MRRVIGAVVIYWSSTRVIVWRAASCLRHCGRLSSPVSVMCSHLDRANELSNNCHDSLPAEVKTDNVESCKVLEAL